MGECQYMNLNQEPVPQFMTVAEVAQRLNVSQRTVYRYIKDEKNPLPVVYLSKPKTPRIPWDQFDIWIKEHAEVVYKPKEGGE